MVSPFSSNGRHDPRSSSLSRASLAGLASLADLDRQDRIGRQFESSSIPDHPESLFGGIGQVLDVDDYDELFDMLGTTSEPVFEASLMHILGDKDGIAIMNISVNAYSCPGCGRIHEITVDIMMGRSCPIHGMHTDEIEITIDGELIKALIEESFGDIAMLNGYVPAELHELLLQL